MLMLLLAWLTMCTTDTDPDDLVVHYNAETSNLDVTQIIDTL